MSKVNEQFQGHTQKCPKCQENIQVGAKKCKHCQTDLRNWFVRHKIITAILIFFAFVVIINVINGDKDNSTNIINNSTHKSEMEPAIKITAKDLYSQYEENEIQADELYKNKLLEVSGTIENIGKDILDVPYVSLKTNNILGSVQCMLADTEKSKAAGLSKGQSIVLEGKNSGKMMNVILRECVIK